MQVLCAAFLTPSDENKEILFNISQLMMEQSSYQAFNGN